jgi:hypothetical protein
VTADEDAINRLRAAVPADKAVARVAIWEADLRAVLAALDRADRELREVSDAASHNLELNVRDIMAERERAEKAERDLLELANASSGQVDAGKILARAQSMERERDALAKQVEVLREGRHEAMDMLAAVWRDGFMVQAANMPVITALVEKYRAENMRAATDAAFKEGL